jgi:hypothetical protein
VIQRSVCSRQTGGRAAGDISTAQYECITIAGPYLLVVAIAEGEEAFIVTARAMTDAEEGTFHRKAR